MSDGMQVPGGGRISEEIAFRPLNIAVLTISDTRDETSDTSGKLLADRVVRDGHILADRAIVIRIVFFDRRGRRIAGNMRWH